MKNSLYNDFRGPVNPIGQVGQILNQFNQFCSTFQGNAETQVKQMLQSGQMSQEQFREIGEFATQLRQFIK